MNFIHIILASDRGSGAHALVAFWWSTRRWLASCRRCLPSCRHRDALSSKGSIHHMPSGIPKSVPNGMSHPSEEPSSLCSHRFGSLDEPSRFAVAKSICAGSSPEEGWELQKRTLFKLRMESLRLRNSTNPMLEASWQGLAVPVLSYAPEQGSSIQSVFWELSLASASSQTVLGKYLGSSPEPKLCQDHTSKNGSRPVPWPVPWQCLSAQT